MQFIVSSSGRPIGTTDLDFMRILDSSRSGWFHPNELGEKLMPNIAQPCSAMRAFVCRDLRDEHGQHVVQPTFRSSSLFADLAEAYHRIEEMELTLHRADGKLIPTVHIGIQDTQQLLDLTRWNDLDPESDLTIDEEQWDEEVESALADDFELELADDLELPSRGWQPSDDEEDDLDLDAIIENAYQRLADLPRYQVHVELVDVHAIP